MQFVYVPPGSFVFGSPTTELSRSENEAQHTIGIKRGFYISATEITQKQWRGVMYSSIVEQRKKARFEGHGAIGDDYPMYYVSPTEAETFCEKLSSIEKGAYRLPTEAEWEYACRAKTNTPFNTGRSLDTDMANFDGTAPCNFPVANKIYRGAVLPVKSFPPNSWGIYEMHGNVAEWCLAVSLKDDTLEYDPYESLSIHRECIRGGSFTYCADGCRSANREVLEDLVPRRLSNVGFRIIKLQSE